jgi:hypothetical protein
MHETLNLVTRIIETGRSNEAAEARWTRHLLRLLPVRDPVTGLRNENDTERFTDLCHHLAGRAGGREDLRSLVGALVTVQRTLSWAEPLFVELDEILAHVIDDLYETLAETFRGTDDAETAAELYAEMRDHCFGLDGPITVLAAASPHVNGRIIVEDFYETIAERLPDGLLHKLEAEGEGSLLDEIIGWDESAALARVETLADPDRYLEGLLERCRRYGTSTPLWVWHTGALDERFDLLRKAVPWDEIVDYADEETHRLIDEHLADELGSDQECWENLVCLEVGFCGTLEELVTAAKHL